MFHTEKFPEQEQLTPALQHIPDRGEMSYKECDRFIRRNVPSE